MRMIDEARFKTTLNLFGYVSIPITRLKTVLESSTEDAMPVVRCKDCKWKPRNMGCKVDVENLDFPLDSDSYVICPYGSDDPWYNREPDPNGFCSRGERKDGANDETV